MVRRLMRFRAGLAGGAAILASAVLAVTAVSAPAAHASTIQGDSIFTYYDLCLADTASGLALQTCSSTVDENQIWNYIIDSQVSGVYQFQNAATGLCLNGLVGPGGVTAQSCSNSADTYSEDWYFDYSFAIDSSDAAPNEGGCLENVSGKPAVVHGCGNQGVAFQWALSL